MPRKGRHQRTKIHTGRQTGPIPWASFSRHALIVAVMSLAVALRLPPEIPAGTSFVLVAVFLGLGTGGVFAWVAELTPAERVGAVTGIVGACGGLGGFFPPLVMGATYNEAEHSYTIGLVLLTITAAGALLFTLFGIKRRTPTAG